MNGRPDFQLGVDRLLREPALRAGLHRRRVALLGHPASMTSDFVHSLDALAAVDDLRVVSALGPQHGMRGDLQDNMMESPDYVDPVHRIPVFSLYGRTRRLTEEMLDTFDVLLVDLQDLGCRIYTFLTTLFYVLEDCSRAQKSVWVLDRPNPAGRPIEGRMLRPGWESFVGGASIPIRHGMTLGEMARWYCAERGLEVDCQVVPMAGYDPTRGPGFGWPEGILSWVNPSPNAPNLSMARCYAGTVLGEGTTLSEGRGTTRPLEWLGAPNLDPRSLLDEMQALAPEWLAGCHLRPCFYEPTFHKHKGQLCRGIQMHVDQRDYRHEAFRPFRVVSLLFRAIRQRDPEYPLWRWFEYEYEKDRWAIDLISGSDELRLWVDRKGTPAEWDALLVEDERSWDVTRRPHLLYPG